MSKIRYQFRRNVLSAVAKTQLGCAEGSTQSIGRGRHLVVVWLTEMARRPTRNMATISLLLRPVMQYITPYNAHNNLLPKERQQF